MNEWLKKQLVRLGLAREAAELAATRQDEAGELTLLLVDDIPDNLEILVSTLKPLGHKLVVAKNGATALRLARQFRPALVLLDVMMPEMDGFEVCRRLKKDLELRQSAVIFCSALHETSSKVKGLELGAVDFITKPFEPEEVIARVGTHLAVQQLAASLEAQNRALLHQLEIASENQRESMARGAWCLFGESFALNQLKATLEAAAQVHTPILLRGQPYSGEDAVARSIHRASPRSSRPFISVDCSRLLDSEEAGLFEAQAGAPSKLSLAWGGTLYLEHVQHLSSQARDRLCDLLLRDDPERARVIAFLSREDPDDHDALLKLLTAYTVRLPSLAERREDVLPMARELLQRHARRLGKQVKDFEAASITSLQQHSWPGNLRELEDVIVRSLAVCSSSQLSVDAGLLQQGIPLGSYRLLDKLGEGGMGEVWRASHQLLRRPAAIKLIRQTDARDAKNVERFRREARAISQLTSPHTVSLYDFGASEQGDFYYVMELLDGLDLEVVLKRGGPLPPERLAHLLVGACLSLAEAHAAGLIHRDVKPANLHFCRLGLELDYVKVLDFGLARQEVEGESRLTREDSAFGTPDYIAPETVAGLDVLDGRTDMYSLTAYHLLVGEPVFSGSSIQRLLMHAKEQARPIDERVPLPPVLSQLIMACLSKKLEERPTAEAMLDRLRGSGLPQQWTQDAARSWWAEVAPPAAKA